VPDLLEGQADALGKDDEGDAPQDRAWVTPMPGPRPLGADQAAFLVEAQGRSSDTAARGDLADGQLLFLDRERKPAVALDFKFT
jgi:hypothetical protein